MITTLKSKSLIFFLIAGSLLLFFFFSKPALSAQAPYKVSGWAWSSTVGWVSFNCINLNSCATVVYGVSLDPATGVLSGYAWSDVVCWISFNQTDLTGCPSGSCKAEISGGLTNGTFPK